MEGRKTCSPVRFNQFSSCGKLIQDVPRFADVYEKSHTKVPTVDDPLSSLSPITPRIRLCAEKPPQGFEIDERLFQGSLYLSDLSLQAIASGKGGWKGNHNERIRHQFPPRRIPRRDPPTRFTVGTTTKVREKLTHSGH
jgi:hypothetical protein